MTKDPRELYSRTDGPVDLRDGEVPVLVHALQGAMDAGHAGRLMARHLTRKLPSERLIDFDVDALLDYRSRRPSMVFDDGAWTSYEDPELVVDLIRDDEGAPVLLLHGLEPDLQWERFVAAVRTIIEDFGVTTTIGVHGVPMGVPHTRPMTVTAHATRADLIGEHPNYFSNVQVPGTVSALLEFRLGQEGRDALGYAVNVPHYLAQMEYPQAAAELVRQISRTTGLSLPVGDLEAAGAKVRADIDRQVSGSEEVGAVVHALETQFDSFLSANGEPGRGSLTAPAEELPSADELGAQFEAYLAGKDGDSD
ncbi:PAC2 family protein [Occultella aeris]|uniref:PAC2 family protein n=1 Tax=Occultella aeris TaxID=2761496 RepID=A0A7M4DP01_9MICO|nr:PAC2 family protein [Occultella aeris]VZO39187.1 PAC2 family protein [Occultella aeris]